MCLSIPAILLSAVPWILLGIISVLSQPLPLHLELVQYPSFHPLLDTVTAKGAGLVLEDTMADLSVSQNTLQQHIRSSVCTLWAIHSCDL